MSHFSKRQKSNRTGEKGEIEASCYFMLKEKSADQLGTWDFFFFGRWIRHGEFHCNENLRIMGNPVVIGLIGTNCM